MYMGMGLTLPMLKLMIFTTYLYEFTDYNAGSIEIEKAKKRRQLVRYFNKDFEEVEAL